jgi:hypothetical protein
MGVIMKFYVALLLFVFPLFYSFTEEDRFPLNIEPGKYRMLDYPVNIRNQPNLNGRVIGQLQLHDEIEVIENMGNEQIIDDVLQNWYKIKYSNIEGYIWGGYIAIETFVFDIDNNGTDDYVYYRIAYVDDHRRLRNVFFPNDIFIYINDKKIITTAFNNITSSWDGARTSIRYFRGGIWLDIFDNRVRIHLYSDARNPVGGVQISFDMDSNGIITFLFFFL